MVNLNPIGFPLPISHLELLGISFTLAASGAQQGSPEHFVVKNFLFDILDKDLIFMG
jgi:hypothetical protein|tara:strand:+ start:276 stop:446 length:171 start_codon:yes stop_codon:yes gene_type:complete